MEQQINEPQADAVATSLFEALPAVALAVDESRRILSLNRAAQEFLRREPFEVLERRPGDVFGCVNAAESSRGCGHAAECRDCLVRRSADEAIAGQRVSQREVRVRVGGQGAEELIFLLSAGPWTLDGERRALILLQDVTVLHRLRGLLPICAACKKIRRQDQAWEVLEAFIESHSHAEFTHGICPDCMAELYPELRERAR